MILYDAGYELVSDAKFSKFDKEVCNPIISFIQFLILYISTNVYTIDLQLLIINCT